MQGVRACHARVSPQLPTQQPAHRSRNHVALRSTKGKSMTDIVNILRQRHHNVTGGNPLIEPIEGPTIFSEAADEIVRLRAERDDVRREYCRRIACPLMDITNENDEDRMEWKAREIADKFKWDCFGGAA